MDRLQMQTPSPERVSARSTIQSTYSNNGLSDFTDRRRYPYTMEFEPEIKKEDSDGDDKMGGLTPTRQ